MYESSLPLVSQIHSWGYPAMLLLMILEGPISTIVAAFLASMGYFNIGIVFSLSVLGDVIGDLILYWIGRYGGRPALLKAERVLKISSSVVEMLEHKFKTSGAKIIFSVKATTGLCWITFILAGSAHMPLGRFIKYSILGGFIWSAFLVIIGYFFGYAAEQIEQYITYAGYVIFALAVASIVAVNLYKKKQSKELLRKS